MKRKLGPKPEWIKPGMIVDYHSIIGGPVTQPTMEVIQGPLEMCGSWVVWLKGKSGCVAVDACTPVARQDIKIFQLNDCDWVAAGNLEEAIEYYLDQVGTPKEKASPETRAAEREEYIEDPHQVSDESMGRLFIHFENEPGIKRTFSEELARLHLIGQRFPVLFCSTEY